MINSANEHTTFELGKKRSDNFTRDVYFKVIFKEDNPLNSPIANVTFAPGSKTKWHTHLEGQVIIVTDGQGWYQEEGGPRIALKRGDVVHFKKGVKHWHGAGEDTWMAHLAMTPGKTEWHKAVEE